MVHDVVSAVYRGGYRIEVVFDDGRRGVVDFSDYPARGGVFSRLKDAEFFRSFKINRELGVLTWGEDLDIAPETLYAMATGAPLPEWMKNEAAPQGKALQAV